MVSPPARETRVCFLPPDHLHLFPFLSWTFFFFSLSLKHHFRLFVNLTNNSQLDYWLVCATRNTSNREDVFCCNRPEHGYWWLLIAYEITCICMEFMGFPDGAVVKSQPAKCRRHRDVGSVFRSGRSPGVGDGKPTPIFSRKIPRTEEPGGLQSMGSQRVRYN